MAMQRRITILNLLGGLVDLVAVALGALAAISALVQIFMWLFPGRG